MKKLDIKTPNLTDENIKRLIELFPTVATEVENDHGELERVVDYDALRELLGDVAEGSRERYQFTWPGKREAKAEAHRPIEKTMRPCPAESVNWDTTENLYIEGDNLDALKILRETYAGKVKLIYIDPPYNTGNDFVYDDDFAQTHAEYNSENGEYDEEGGRLVANPESSGRFHSDWCSMMYPRLILMRDLLDKDGVVCISIDYNENARLRLLADEVFGSNAFVGEIYWESKTKSQNTSTSYDRLQPKVEMILVYSKMEKPHFNLVVTGEVTYPERDEKGSWRPYPVELMDASGSRGRATMIYPISDGISTVCPPKGKQWQLGLDLIATYKDRGDLFIENDKPYLKMRPGEERLEKTKPFWGFFSKEIGTAESAKKELSQLIEKHGFETVKPVELLKRLVYHMTDKDSLILDFFSGSASSSHAVMCANSDDAGSRKYIAVQIPESIDQKRGNIESSFQNICELGKERIRRAGAQISAEIEESNKQLAFDDEPRSIPDIGFRVMKIDSSNFKNTYTPPQEIQQAELFGFVDNVKDDRSGEDLLFQMLPKFRIPYSASIEKLFINDKLVFNVDDGLLIACFDTNVDTDTIEQIARKQPSYVVMRDLSFKSDEDEQNFEELFKTFSPDTIRRVI